MNTTHNIADRTVPSVSGDVQRRAELLAKPLHSTGQTYMSRRALLILQSRCRGLGNAKPLSAHGLERAVCGQWFTAIPTYLATLRPA